MSAAYNPSPDAQPLEIRELNDERDPAATQALDLVGETFPRGERQPLHELALELQEKRLQLLVDYDFHLFAGLDEDGAVQGVAVGLYLGGVNAGFVTYLAVRPQCREGGLGRRLRTRLVEAFRDDAKRTGWPELNWVVGEVKKESPWLDRLVRERGAICLDLTYYHPGTGPGRDEGGWILYRQPVGDDRRALPVVEVKRLLYSIWRRAYRVRYPLERDGFVAMLGDLEGRAEVDEHPAAVAYRQRA
jgi:ribosomal protein S18 acetylase RimI-like enzyme